VNELKLELPGNMRAAEGPHGLSLIGEAGEITDVCKLLRALCKLPSGSVRSMGGWTLLVVDHPPQIAHPKCVAYSAKEWAVAAGVLVDVAVGRNISPLNFGDVGFGPRSNPDIGVSLCGVVRYDWQSPSMDSHHFDVPENAWPEVKDVFAQKNQSVVLRMENLSSWIADVISLTTGEVVKSQYATANSLQDMLNLLRWRGDGGGIARSPA
jgi:hypothetical protein